VIDVIKPVEGLAVVQIKPTKGMLTIGESYQQETDQQLRNLTARNHTATHMLHWALRKVLGTHVKQAGSLVTSDLLRFDFNHFQALTEAELTEIEQLINDRIFSEQVVRKDEMEKDQAIAAGAIAFFGEKYGDRVRVVRVGEFSTELCGGTHVNNTAEINLFVIAQESSIAAGVRRIIAYTSQKAFEYLKAREQETRIVRSKLKAASLDDVTIKLDKLLQSERDLKKQIEKLRAQSLAQQIDTILEESPLVQDTRVVTFLCPEDDQGVKTLRELSDQILQKAPNTVVVLGMKQESVGKAFLLVAKGKQVATGFSSQELLQKLAPEINGRGGGKADMAQAGGDKLDGLKTALNKARDLVPPLFGKG
jgi:alanyl-tRNA synthetase